jgi:hypothetical protein
MQKNKTDYRLATPALTAEELDKVLADEIAAVQNDAGRVKQGMAVATLADVRIKLCALRIQAANMKRQPESVRLLEKPLPALE